MYNLGEWWNAFGLVGGGGGAHATGGVPKEGDPDGTMNWNAPGITEGESGLLSLPRGGHADGRMDGRKEREEVECQSVNRWMSEEMHVRIWRTMRADGLVNETKGGGGM